MTAPSVELLTADPAAGLRAVAALIREDAADAQGGPALPLAIADLLDHYAAIIASVDRQAYPLFRREIAVARAYLTGEVPK